MCQKRKINTKDNSRSFVSENNEKCVDIYSDNESDSKMQVRSKSKIKFVF